MKFERILHVDMCLFTNKPNDYKLTCFIAQARAATWVSGWHSNGRTGNTCSQQQKEWSTVHHTLRTWHLILVCVKILRGCWCKWGNWEWKHPRFEMIARTFNTKLLPILSNISTKIHQNLSSIGPCRLDAILPGKWHRDRISRLRIRPIQAGAMHKVSHRLVERSRNGSENTTMVVCKEYVNLGWFTMA